MKNALILVDMQNDFIDGSLAVPNASEVLGHVLEIIKNHKKNNDLVIATIDSHTSKHSSFKVNGGPWPVHCVINTDGWKIHDSIDNKDIDFTIRKGEDDSTESYSGFSDENKKSNGLNELLKKHGVTDIYICGLALDFCVKETILDGVEFGYNVHLYKSGTSSVFKENSEDNFKKLKEKGVILI